MTWIKSIWETIKKADPESFSHVCDGLFKIFSIFGIIAAGYWAYFEYEEAKDAKRIERSMRYVQALETERVNTSIGEIAAFWSRYDWGDIPAEERPKELIRVVYEEKDYQNHLKVILNHLDEITYCIEYNICDEKIVLESKKGLFKSGFSSHFGWLVAHRNLTGHKTYFRHLECFVITKFPEFKIKSENCVISEAEN